MADLLEKPFTIEQLAAQGAAGTRRSAPGTAANLRPWVVVSFARGVPAPECLPVSELADCARAAIEADGNAVLSYGPGGGYGPLREWIAERHGVEPSRVVVTSGSLQGFVFLVEQLVAAGRARARRGADLRPPAEDPHAARRRDRRRSPMDDEGLVPEALERALADGAKPAFLYTIATFQNPSGRTLSEERRRRVVEIAREHELLVLEDDPYGLVRYEGEAPADALRARGRHERRLRVVVLEDDRSRRARRLLRAAAGARGADRGARRLDVHLAAVHDAGDRARVPAPRQLRAEPRARATGLLKARRDAMLEALERHMPTARRGAGPRAATSSGSTLPGRHRATCSRSAEAAGVTFVEGDGLLRRRRRRRASLRLAFSFVSPEEIADGIAKLAPLLQRCAGARRLRSSCASRIPPTKPMARLEQDQPDERDARGREHEVQMCTDFRFSSTNAIAYAASSDERDQPRVELRLPVLLELVGVDARAAAEDARAQDPTRRRRRRRRACEARARRLERRCEPPAVCRRNVGQGVSPGRAQRPARRK